MVTGKQVGAWEMGIRLGYMGEVDASLPGVKKCIAIMTRRMIHSI